MTAQQTVPPDPFETALARYLESQREPVPPRLAVAVDELLRDAVPSGHIGRPRAPIIRPRPVLVSLSAITAAVVIVVGTLAYLGGSPDPRPADIAGQATPSEAPAAPSPTSTSLVLDGVDDESKPAPRPTIAGDDDALVSALDSTDRAENLLGTEPEAALDFYRAAWSEVERARNTGLAAPALDALEVRVRNGLDSLYDARTPAIEQVTALPRGADPVGLVEGARKGAFYIDRSDAIVARVNLRNGRVYDVVHEGDKAAGSSRAVDRPAQLAAAGPDVVIVDEKGRPWGWRSSNAAGSGTLRKITLQDSPSFLPGHGDVEAYEGVGLYRIYVAEPELNQVMRYQQTFDGSAFLPPSPYLASQTAEVADFDQLYIDFDVYALINNTLRRHDRGRYDGTFALAEPPDGDDLRPGYEYQIVAGSGRSATNGRVYLYDAQHDRIVGFSKVDGRYLGQWASKEGSAEMGDIRGMYVIEGQVNKKGKRKDDTLVWATPRGIYRAVLVLG